MYSRVFLEPRAKDFEFRLFGDLNGGVAVGALRRPNVTVTDGVFSVILDFGSFPAANRFLEIGFRPVGVGPLTTLAPRIQLLSVPYSTRANEAEHASTAANAVNAQNAEQAVNARDAANARHADHAHTAQNALRLGDTPAKDFVRRDDPRLSDPRSPLPGSAAHIQNGATEQASSSFNISGNGTAGGTLTGNVVSAATHFSIGIAPVLVSAGVSTPSRNRRRRSSGSRKSSEISGRSSRACRRLCAETSREQLNAGRPAKTRSDALSIR